MWSLLFLYLSYIDGDFAKLSDESPVSLFLLNTASSADTSVQKSGEQETQDRKDIHTLRRLKRGFTYPGTLWCGAGNIADHYHQLGEFAETDKCCRTHDHCPHVIHAFSSKYGFTNFKLHSISHCDCDNAMKQCLRMVNDSSSRVVGQAFFNIIEAPCFEFSLEEQCVERHWYGMCKRYDKVPVAVIKESVAYDFGGIEVIDVLTIPPHKKNYSEQDEGKQEQSRTQPGSKSHAPGEPSLTNVVTAAEDFIKVLATVSTSQSSSTDGGNTGETQSSDKKRKKTTGKKKKDPKKRRGQGEKKKQNTGRLSKSNWSVTGAPSVNRAEDIINKNNFVEDYRVRKNDNFRNPQFSSMANIEHANKMMRDENQRTPDKSLISTTTALDLKQQAKTLEPQNQIKNKESVQFFSTVPLTIMSKPTTTILRQRVAKKRQRHPTPTFLPIKDTLHNMIADNTAVSTTESTSLAGLTAQTPISLTREEAPQNFEFQHEKGSVFNATTQNTPIVGIKRLSLRQKGGRRKSRKQYSPSSPIDTLTTEEPKFLSTEITQELAVGLFSEPQKLQSNDKKKMSEKTTSDVSGKIQLKALKGTGIRKRGRRPKFNSSEDARQDKPRQEASLSIVTSTSAGSGIHNLAKQAKDAEPSSGQLFSYRLQTITPSLLPLKTRTPKRKTSKERDAKKRRKNKGTPI